MPATAAEVVVLGAGPAGLGIGLALGERALVLDAAPAVGGLARTIDVDGAVFDLGGHSFHTPHPHVRDLVFDALPMEEQARDAWCLVGGDWVPYPFQKHFERLSDPDRVVACRRGLARAAPAADAPDFNAYLDARFGTGIAEAFMRPYNRKLWGDDLARMTSTWTGERVAAPAGTRERFDIAGGQRRPLQDDTRVAYPAEGGFGAIFVALALRVPRLALGVEVLRIDTRTRTVLARDGWQVGYDRLVSTMPLPRLLDAIDGAPADLVAAVGRLEALPVALVMVAHDGPLPTSKQRVYVPDGALPGHKVVLNANSSRSLRMQPRQGIQVEVSGPALARVGMGDLVARTVDGLAACGLIHDRRRIAGTRVLVLPHGYPVPTHERPVIVAQAKRWLARHGIDTLGRFGEWDYINADEALARGLAWGASPRMPIGT